jgi:hypothetical protein
MSPSESVTADGLAKPREIQYHPIENIAAPRPTTQRVCRQFRYKSKKLIIPAKVALPTSPPKLRVPMALPRRVWEKRRETRLLATGCCALPPMPAPIVEIQSGQMPVDRPITTIPSPTHPGTQSQKAQIGYGACQERAGILKKTGEQAEKGLDKRRLCKREIELQGSQRYYKEYGVKKPVIDKMHR